MKRLTVDAYELHELPERVRERVIRREREAMQDVLHSEAICQFPEEFREVLDGLDSIAVPSWSLHYRRFAALSADVTDPAAFVASLGMEGYDCGDGLGIAEGDEWYSSVWRFDGDDERIDVALTAELERVSRDVVRAVEALTDSMESDDAITEGIEDLGILFLHDGHPIADATEVDA